MKLRFSDIRLVPLILRWSSARLAIALLTATFPCQAEDTASADGKNAVASPAMPEHRKQLTAGPEEIVVDIGELRSGKESPVRLVLTNGTAIGLEVAEISASCGCVVGKAEKKKVPPGGNIEIDAMLKPTSIVDLFEQKMVLHFTGGVISPKEILLRARVIGDVEVTPRTLRFVEGETTQALEINATADGVRIDSFEPVSGVLIINETELVSDAVVRLHVTPTISSGQGIELLRIKYTDTNDGKTLSRVAEVKLGVSSAKDYRFIPSSVRLNAESVESSRRVFFVLSGRFCPAEDEAAEIFVYLKSGQHVKVPESKLSFHRSKDRLFEIKIQASMTDMPSGSQGIVMQFADRAFLLPFEFEDVSP